MYESFFGFVNRPFIASPSLERYFPSTAIEQTVQTATRAIARSEGPIAIIGGTGLGKTICCLRIAEYFRHAFDIITLSSAALVTRRALLQNLLYELKLPYKDLSEGELRLSLVNRLQPSPDVNTDGVLLMIDEAQVLSLKLLDEIRLLTNIQRNGLPRVRLVLCGNLKLEEILCNPQMDSLNQRLASRCYLTPLSREETARYVIHKIELCGVNYQRVITQDALEALYRGSDGIPRLIDQLADQAMLIAAKDRVCPVDANIVGKAWGMLQQLPNPWCDTDALPKSSFRISPNADVEDETNVSFEQASIQKPSEIVSAKDNGPCTTPVSPGEVPQGQTYFHPPHENLVKSEQIGAPGKGITADSRVKNLGSIIEFGDLDDSDEEMADSHSASNLDSSLIHSRAAAFLDEADNGLEPDDLAKSGGQSMVSDSANKGAFALRWNNDEIEEFTDEPTLKTPSETSSATPSVTKASSMKPSGRSASRGDSDHASLLANSKNQISGNRRESLAAFESQTQFQVDRRVNEDLKENVFGDDFDEEFDLPNYQQDQASKLSGIAFGQLNHDLEEGLTAGPMRRYELEEANEFIQPSNMGLWASGQENSDLKDTQENRIPSDYSIDRSIEVRSASNDSEEMLDESEDLYEEVSEHDGLYGQWSEDFIPAYSDIYTPGYEPETYGEDRTLEDMVEEEMRELVSELNLSAMAFDPTQIIVELEPNDEQMLTDEELTNDTPFLGRRAYAQMREEWNEGQAFAESSKMVASDDRDMLVIEDDAESTVAPKAQTADTQTTQEEDLPKPVLHPYAKLFSNLRRP